MGKSRGQAPPIFPKFEHIPPGQTTPATIATYTYGRRLSKTVNGTTTNFHWEGDNLAMELDASFNPIRRYTYGLGKDSVEGHIEFSEASSNLFAHPYGWYSYIKDQVGTIYKIHSQQTQSTVTSRHYDTFGNLLSQSGPTKGNLGFQSKYYDQESGLNYFYHRYYDPSIGRFITEDPLGLNAGLNLFEFVRNNPINLSDPYGLVTGGWSVEIKYVSLKEFGELFNVWKNGKLHPSDLSVSSNGCVQLNNGKWYPRFNFTFHFTIYVVDRDLLGKRNPKKVKNILRHEWAHFIDIYAAYRQSWNEFFQMETDYENGFSSKCDCEESAQSAIGNAVALVEYQSGLSVVVRDIIEWIFILPPGSL